MPELKEQLQRTLGDNYSLERELGGGGMSRVFVRATPGRTLAIVLSEPRQPNLNLSWLGIFGEFPVVRCSNRSTHFVLDSL